MTKDRIQKKNNVQKHNQKVALVITENKLKRKLE